MNSRDRREPLDHLDILVRESLRASTVGKYPSCGVRQDLLRRAAGLGRGGWRLPLSLPGIFNAAARFSYRMPSNHQMVTIEALFGPRLGWFSYNQIMR